jgi:hypothetical protein
MQGRSAQRLEDEQIEGALEAIWLLRSERFRHA